MEGHITDVLTVAISSSGNWIASGGSNGQIKIWDIYTGEIVLEINGKHSQPVTIYKIIPYKLFY